MEYFKYFGIVILSTFASYKTYNYAKKYLQEYILKRVMEELDRRLKEEEDQEHFKPIHKNSVVVKVKHAGNTHPVFLPYNRRKSTAMLRKKVFLIKEDQKIDISQKPGIPYLVSAEDLGGEKIIVENLDGEIVHSYSGKEIPNCF